MNFKNHKSRLVLVLLLTTSWLLTESVTAQDVSVFVFRDGGGSSKKTGKVSQVSPDGLMVDGELVPASRIRKISISREPSEIDRGRDQMLVGRYSDCLEELKKIEKPPTNPLLIQEIDFMKAYCSAQVSLQLGTIGPAEAGAVVSNFLSKHSNSFHVYPAQERYGQLIFAFGKPDAAAAEFAKLQQAKWTEYRLKGYFLHGRMMEILGKFPEAARDYDSILQESGTDDITQNYQLLAQCQKSKLVGVQGNHQAAVDALNDMIKDQNSDNKILFGHLYNALGAVHEAAGNLKAARLAYMHTQLLYGSEAEPHAEAMYRLAKLWPQLEDTQRANDAREILKTRYRNSYWSQKL